MHETTRSSLPLSIQSRGLKIIPTYRNPQIENVAGIQTHRQPNLDRKISIAAGLMACGKSQQTKNKRKKQMDK